MKDRKIVGETTRCIRCHRPAKYHAGHVTIRGGDVLAGLCEQHRKADCPDVDGDTGSFGRWQRKYGLKTEGYSK